MDYVSHVTRISTDAEIVFDGYNESNTKDHAHQKRNPLQSLCIEFPDCSRETFLSNTGNK